MEKNTAFFKMIGYSDEDIKKQIDLENDYKKREEERKEKSNKAKDKAKEKLSGVVSKDYEKYARGILRKAVELSDVEEIKKIKEWTDFDCSYISEQLPSLMTVAVLNYDLNVLKELETFYFIEDLMRGVGPSIIEATLERRDNFDIVKEVFNFIVKRNKNFYNRFQSFVRDEYVYEFWKDIATYHRIEKEELKYFIDVFNKADFDFYSKRINNNFIGDFIEEILEYYEEDFDDDFADNLKNKLKEQKEKALKREKDLKEYIKEYDLD